ncbi:MAG: UvrD-helicase domain-containing protein [Bifidobacteriaceae bacterium]|jgi:DNA helicase-2/ATP-dependent DNA helicase PcrA|nr:UvrD-helicase domain-containing protein [Bifidobacteriaceae bacterium]
MEHSPPALIDLTRLPSLAPTAWDAAEAEPYDPAYDPAPLDAPPDEWSGPRDADRARAAAAEAAEAAAAAERLLDGLNAEQKAAVTHTGTPLLILAGAGSGKTRVLTRRIAYLLATGQARPGEILAITFTNKAAAEMRERVERLVGHGARHMWVSTFHSACVRILRREAEHLGLKRSFSIYDAQDSLRLVTMAMAELNLDPKRFQPKSIARRISNLKNELVDADSYAAAQPPGGDPIDRATADVYKVYQGRLQGAHAFDFDDLIMQTVNLLQAFPDVADHYHRRFRHVLVDEYQDTNYAQYVLVRELTGTRSDAAAPGGHTPAQLTVVGDSDQSIYAFRGATVRNIVEFATDYPDAATILLEQNYRSTQNILSAANAVIAPNQGARRKRLWTQEGAGPKVVGYVADTEHDEAQFIARELDSLADQHGVRPGDAAVFYRTNAQSRALEEVFVRGGIPYRVVGGTRFYERKEIRDAIAYLRAVDNIDDAVSTRRIFNVPKRGLGAQAEAAVAAWAASHGLSFGGALARHDEIDALTPRAKRAVAELDHLLDELSEMARHGAGPAQILDHVLDRSGYLAELQDSRDPQDASRVENLAEMHAVASEFEQTQPNGSLADFLERVSLVADSDQLPQRAGAADTDAPPPDADRSPAGVAAPSGARVRDPGQVTLMTVHTAKGLEFPVVFVTGLEDGTFPHRRSANSELELQEERRLVYVALTRARERLYLSRAEARTVFGRAEYFPASRFLGDIPNDVLDWRRERGSTGALQAEQPGPGPRRGNIYTRKTRPAPLGGTAAAFGSATPRPASDVPRLEAGDLVTHDAYGLGRVVAVEGGADNQVARIEFREDGTKRILVRFAPITKL